MYLKFVENEDTLVQIVNANFVEFIAVSWKPTSKQISIQFQAVV